LTRAAFPAILLRAMMTLRSVRLLALAMILAAFGGAFVYAVDIFGGEPVAKRFLTLHLTAPDGRVHGPGAFGGRAAFVVGPDDPEAIEEIARAVAELGPLSRSVRALVLADRPLAVPPGVEVLIGTREEVAKSLESAGFARGRVLLVTPGGEVAGDFPAGRGASELAAAAARRALKR